MVGGGLREFVRARDVQARTVSGSKGGAFDFALAKILSRNRPTLRGGADCGLAFPGFCRLVHPSEDRSLAGGPGCADLSLAILDRSSGAGGRGVASISFAAAITAGLGLAVLSVNLLLALFAEVTDVLVFPVFTLISFYTAVGVFAAVFLSAAATIIVVVFTLSLPSSSAWLSVAV